MKKMEYVILKGVKKAEIIFNNLIAKSSFDNLQAFKRFSGVLVKGSQVIKTKTVALLKRNIRLRGYFCNSIKYWKLEKGIRTGKNEGLKSVFVHIMSDFCVPGSSFTGDKVLARLNSGEMVLNRGQQNRLFNMLNSGASGNGGRDNVQFVLRGMDLTGLINNTQRKRSL
jgi:hypothetical protein